MLVAQYYNEYMLTMHPKLDQHCCNEQSLITACLPAGAMDVSLSPGTYFTLISGTHSSIVPNLRLDCEQDVDKSRAHGRFATACAITALINEQPLQKVADTWGAPGGIVRDGVGL